MPTRDQHVPLITSASHGKSLDVEARTKRYLITMGIRTACFFAMIFVPGWWKLVMLVGAAFLPAVAVLLANAQDLRGPQPSPDEQAPADARAITEGYVVRGEVDEDR